ncbi:MULTISPECIES: zeta toxin family protein [Streptomyces]|uniref:zeta toxin family protein n=1 Tax=Streptomyces TaxID=1883 RepID=UPI0004BFF93F|nr:MULTISPECIES: zeta toxin family protein [unclassified Streptomyces]
MLTGEYAQLYAELQTRMDRGGDLSPGPTDTEARFRNGLAWDKERRVIQRAVIERFKAEFAGLPRGGSAVLLTAGAPGAGKSTVQHRLGSWQNEDSELGRLLTSAHGLKVEDYVVLDPDEFKRALHEAGGMPQLSPEQMALSFGRELTPAEMSGLLHRESSYIRDQLQEWARAEGCNLLLDATLANEGAGTKLLGDLARDGYDQRVILSVEVPLETSLAQNASRWQTGRIAYEQGADPYGGRMAPQEMIRALYAKNTTGLGHSISRQNAEKLVEQGLATGLITTERGAFTPTGSGTAVPARQTAPTYARGEFSVGIAAAGKLRSPRTTAPQTTPAQNQNQGTRPTTPRHTPPSPGGPTR